MKFIPRIFVCLQNVYYLCNVLQLLHAPKIRKRGYK
nr:MAG TPA: hypothetical protein [Caudoviricetes sp.]